MRARTIGFSVLALSALFLPFIAVAQVTVESTLNRVLNILNGVIFLFITNFVPLAGVLFFGWKLFPILF